MEEAGASVIVATVGQQWHGSWREECARRWRVVDAGQASQALRQIRWAGARIVVVIFLPDARRLELLELLRGPSHRTWVVAVATVHTDRFEREVRACGVACYIPLTRDFTPVLRAVDDLMDRMGDVGAARARRREGAPESSFPPLMSRGRRG